MTERQEEWIYQLCAQLGPQIADYKFAGISESTAYRDALLLVWVEKDYLEAFGPSDLKEIHDVVNEWLGQVKPFVVSQKTK